MARRFAHQPAHYRYARRLRCLVFAVVRLLPLGQFVRAVVHLNHRNRRAVGAANHKVVAQTAHKIKPIIRFAAFGHFQHARGLHLAKHHVIGQGFQQRAIHVHFRCRHQRAAQIGQLGVFCQKRIFVAPAQQSNRQGNKNQQQDNEGKNQRGFHRGSLKTKIPPPRGAMLIKSIGGQPFQAAYCRFTSNGITPVCGAAKMVFKLPNCCWICCVTWLARCISCAATWRGLC